MINWDRIQQEMNHVSQFRSLTENDWEKLCETISSEILQGRALNGSDNRDDFLNRFDIIEEERRQGDRRAEDRRDYSQLKNTGEENWDELCARIKDLTVQKRDRDERQNKERRIQSRRGRDGLNS